MNDNDDILNYHIDKNIYYKIIIFDDTNIIYKNYINKWYCYRDNKDKIYLINSENNNIRIESIYIWKTKIFISNK
jgi:hypothetical protein